MLLLPVLLLMSAVSCSSGLVGRPTDRDSKTQVVLKPGDSRRILDTDLTISFDTIVEDSRCPTGVTCIRAGEAIVRIRIDKRDAPASTYLLHTSSQFGREIVHGDVRVRLEDVEPYPTADRQPRPEEYRVTFSLHRR